MQLNSISFSQPVGIIYKTGGEVRKQMLLTIKFTAIILLTACLSANARGYGQITLNVKNAPLQKVFKEIRKQSGYNFLYSAELLQQAGNVSVNVLNASLQHAVEECLKDKRFTYSIVEKTVIIKPKPVMPQANISLQQNALETDKLKGKITGENGQPLEGATVSIKGGNAATQTGKGGNFEIEIEPGSTIIVSYVGYETKELQIGKNMDITLSLKLSDSKGEEIIVIGYGTQKKANLTGAVEQISGEVLDNRAMPNVTQGLQGVIPSLNISLADGKPMRSASYQVRGVSSIGQGGSALVLIDGVEGDPAMLNPNDIASVSVLKDAGSAAIYGARGAFGVVLITTKSPSKGRASVIYRACS